MNKFIQVCFGILWLIMGLAVLYYTKSWIITLASFQPDDILLAIYWVGYALIGICTVFLPPYWLITQAMQNEDQK